jgi:uncharacterized protein YndB with AHSA1/START domain
MSSQGEVISVQAVKFVRLLPGTVDQAWSYLTETQTIAEWYGEDGRIEPREGGAVWLMGGHIRGVVTQWKPGRRLTYTWNVFSEGEEESSYPESYLTLELDPSDTNMKLTLTHMPIPPKFSVQTRMGWHTYLDLIAAVANGEVPEPREAYMKRNAERYGVDMNNLAK